MGTRWSAVDQPETIFFFFTCSITVCLIDFKLPSQTLSLLPATMEVTMEAGVFDEICTQSSSSDCLSEFEDSDLIEVDPTSAEVEGDGKKSSSPWSERKFSGKERGAFRV